MTEARKLNGQSQAQTTLREGEVMNKEESVTPEVDLSRLTNEQQSVVWKTLHEEPGVFATNDDDIGGIPNLEKSINLTDPLDKAFPRLQYLEMKQYLQDLLKDKSVIRKSKSPYSSSVVCVRSEVIR